MKTWKRLKVLVVMFGLTSLLVQETFIPVAFAIDFSLRDAKQLPTRDQSEFFNSNPDQRLEAKVNFVGGVRQPGIYHLPDNTNLVEAISLAGGTVENADLSRVYVRRAGPGGAQSFQYDLEKVVSDPNAQFPNIKDHDTVLIEVNNSSQKLITTLAIVSVLLSIVSTGFIIHQTAQQ